MPFKHIHVLWLLANGPATVHAFAYPRKQQGETGSSPPSRIDLKHISDQITQSTSTHSNSPTTPAYPSAGPFRLESHQRRSVTSLVLLTNVSNSQIEPFDARDSNAHAIPKLESAMTLRNKTLHSTAAYGSTDYGPSTIDTQAYQASPRKLGRRKGGHFTTGTALCCMNTADVIDGAGESSGLRTTDGPAVEDPAQFNNDHNCKRNHVITTESRYSDSIICVEHRHLFVIAAEYRTDTTSQISPPSTTGGDNPSESNSGSSLTMIQTIPPYTTSIFFTEFVTLYLSGTPESYPNGSTGTVQSPSSSSCPSKVPANPRPPPLHDAKHKLAETYRDTNLCLGDRIQYHRHPQQLFKQKSYDNSHGILHAYAYSAQLYEPQTYDINYSDLVKFVFL
ncbi:hypothetical protein J7T55_011434 [Diaporthe amygdali]|uniref:uncharacterized protein n=1 Tax=Phomopsis amygdali TaxID=1214568 RepID=UPI0022FE3EA1|nr:uncharacterized protein J7T55_011434 [Diaporthe amygdali]KAJ0122973.1 hypothetical protein J7T55_011434 [Diaporthe amygdali]